MATGGAPLAKCLADPAPQKYSLKRRRLCVQTSALPPTPPRRRSSVCPRIASSCVVPASRLVSRSCRRPHHQTQISNGVQVEDASSHSLTKALGLDAAKLARRSLSPQPPTQVFGVLAFTADAHSCRRGEARLRAPDDEVLAYAAQHLECAVPTWDKRGAIPCARAGRAPAAVLTSEEVAAAEHEEGVERLDPSKRADGWGNAQPVDLGGVQEHDHNRVDLHVGVLAQPLVGAEGGARMHCHTDGVLDAP
eukprot:CAMPEP_0183351860 /NCGR_PEP_ID=MMETSP0164_2-20130417/26300_1 /TAXON_ID=221442 /ORGANISM="Coccolithus pelagicus ssp braarudi, Strain PLY182g" /LENGTH=249 /DNA_ID=CAMNT_0025524153 /DNA_START=202 /DNA_END=953 /DNA_ORIENTATION=-